MAPKTKNEVAVRTDTNLEIFEGMDSGFEKTDASTFKTPFLKVLQAMSPELKKSDPKYVSEAEQGDFCNSATQQIYKDIDVVVLKVEHTLVAWKPDRGGFMGRYSKSREEEIVKDKEGLKKWDADGNNIVDTIEFYCMNINDPTDIFIFPMSTASLKHAKSFATRLRLLKSDGKPVNVSWAGVWKISTAEDSNEKGTWYTLGSTPEFMRFITKEERDTMVVPAKEMLKTAETDYSALADGHEEKEGPSF